MNLKISLAICASAGKLMVVYGCSQSPTTPSRLNSSRWTEIQCSAKARHSRRNAIELFALDGNPVFGKGATLATKRDDRLWIGEVGLRLALRPIKLLLHFPFDRQAMAVPAGDVVGIPAGHLVRADDHVLEDLVERGADVNVAVGVGRPVVQHEFGTAFAAFPQLAVEVLARPARQDLRLLLRQAGPHRKVGHWQEKRLRIVEGCVGRVGHETGGHMGLAGEAATELEDLPRIAKSASGISALRWPSRGSHARAPCRAPSPQ